MWFVKRTLQFVKLKLGFCVSLPHVSLLLSSWLLFSFPCNYPESTVPPVSCKFPFCGRTTVAPQHLFVCVRAFFYGIFMVCACVRELRVCYLMAAVKTEAFFFLTVFPIINVPSYLSCFALCLCVLNEFIKVKLFCVGHCDSFSSEQNWMISRISRA